jgi:transcriptional antiterminator RfaH
MAYWSVAHLQRDELALHCLELAGYEVYYPRLHVRRRRFGRPADSQPALFPRYAFVLIALQWHAARWAPGVIGLVMDGAVPAKVPDAVIAEIRSRERGGLIRLPRRSKFEPGEPVRILQSPFRDRLAIYAGMRPHERVEVLLELLGNITRVTLAQSGVEAVNR